MTHSLLLVNGYIHSTSEPYANALHIDNSVIAWLGADDTAQQMVAATSHGPVTTHDLYGMLVTPAFVDGFSTVPLRSHDARASLSTTMPTESGVYYAPLAVSSEQADGIFVAVEELDQLNTVLEQLKPPTQLLIESRGPHDLDDIFTVMVQQPNAALMRCRHRILLNHEITDEQVESLVERHLSVTVVPEPSGDTPVFRAPIAKLITGGVHVAIGSGAWAGSMWELLTALIEHPDPTQRVSTRAAFNTVARDGIRVLPSRIAQARMGAGQIAVGSPADLNIWRAEQLGVQAPDEKAAHWSTDKRAGTALLPILSSAENAPVLGAIIRDGQLLSFPPDA
ncbi:MAG TPA: hypothetical protein VIG71_08545 [Enteractinococcus sp.]